MEKDGLGGSFWDLWASFWDHWAPLWDTWATSCCMGGPCIEFIEFLGLFLTLWGSPFSPLGITISFPGLWNGENLLFCRQPDSRLDFGMAKTMVWCGRGCQNHISIVIWIFSILGSILKVFLSWKLYQSRYVVHFGGPRGANWGYWEQV